jgi:hypothetical protein
MNEYNHPEIGGKDWHDKYQHSAVWIADKSFQNLYAEIAAWRANLVAWLLGQMDAIQDVGGTLLDNSVVLLTGMFAGLGGHLMLDMPVMVAGSAGGKLRTGAFVDYRNRDGAGTPIKGFHIDGEATEAVLGRPYNDLFTTIFQALGVPKEDFTQPGNTQGGFGDYSKRYSGSAYGQYVDGVDRAKSTLPWLWKS